MRFTSGAPLIGEIDRTTEDWVSTSWASVQVAKPLKYFSGGEPSYYRTRAAFRLLDDRLLIEHVAPAEVREQMREVLAADPRSTRVRERTRDKLARGETVTAAEAIQLADEMVNDEIYRDGNPFRTEWTERSLKTASSVARYTPIGRDDTEWSFPIAYSECQRVRQR